MGSQDQIAITHSELVKVKRTKISHIEFKYEILKSERLF